MQIFSKRRSQGRPAHPDVLTPAEWRVLEQIRAGRTNQEIADRLGVTHNTVKTHVSSMLAKLDVEHRHELAVWQGAPAEASRSVLGRMHLAGPLGWVGNGMATWAGRAAIGASVLALSATFLIVMQSLNASGTRIGGATESGVPMSVLEVLDPGRHWSIEVTPGYRDDDFLIAVCYFGYDGECEGTDSSEVRLIDPSNGEAVVRISTGRQPMVLVREEPRQLLVSFQIPEPNGGIEQQHRVLLFDMATMTMVQEFIAAPRTTTLAYVTPMALSGDGRWLYFNGRPTGGAEDPHPISVLNLETGHTGVAKMAPCHTGSPLLPAADDAILLRDCTDMKTLRPDGTTEAASPILTGVVTRRSDGSLIAVRPSGIGGLASATFLGSDGVSVTEPLQGLPSGNAFLEHQRLPDGRLLLGIRDDHESGTRLMDRLVMLHPDDLRVSSIPLDGKFCSFQLRADGDGVWLLTAAGTVLAVDWDGSSRQMDAVLDTGWLLAPASRQ